MTRALAILEIDPASISSSGEVSMIGIKQSYRRLVLRLHPDKNSESDALIKFLEVISAWNYIVASSGEGGNPESSDTQVSERVSIDKFTRFDDKLEYRCRCGDFYEVATSLTHGCLCTSSVLQISDEEFLEGYNLIQCSGCSLYVSIA